MYLRTNQPVHQPIPERTLLLIRQARDKQKSREFVVLFLPALNRIYIRLFLSKLRRSVGFTCSTIHSSARDCLHGLVLLPNLIHSQCGLPIDNKTGHLDRVHSNNKQYTSKIVSVRGQTSGNSFWGVVSDKTTTLAPTPSTTPFAMRRQAVNLKHHEKNALLLSWQ